ncbi:MAG: NAD(P)H-dependent oxidoreductase subunit E [Eubacteriales bacterium]|nr:NAD(P)H-dependent oxidoreductase subunit E [Eubacteriales bacterium]
MKDIYVCVGSACHLKGSYDVIEAIRNWIDENDLKPDLTVKASFCLGQCTSAVSIKIDDQIYSVLAKDIPDLLSKTICWS